MTLEMKYFVLKPKAKDKEDIYAFASQQAMKTYATAIYGFDTEMSNAIMKWALDESITQRLIKEEE